jgi:hypothetical protein
MKNILPITLIAMTSLLASPVHAGKQAATLGGSSSAVGNSFAPPMPNAANPTASITGDNIPAVLSNIVAPGQGAYTVMAPAASPTLAVAFGTSTPSPVVANAVNVFLANTQAALPQLNAVQVNMPQSATTVNLGSAVQATLRNPTPAAILSTVQLTLVALNQNPNNVAVQQFAAQLVNTFNTIAGNANR